MTAYNDHVMFVQKIKSDKIEEYIKSHKKVWPELLKEIKKSGIEREMIWIFGDYIFLYMMSNDFKKAMDSLSKTKIFQEWSEYMKNFLDEMQDYSNIITLKKVFDLEEQLR